MQKEKSKSFTLLLVCVFGVIINTLAQVPLVNETDSGSAGGECENKDKNVCYEIIKDGKVIATEPGVLKIK